jgi:LysM repeat protein
MEKKRLLVIFVIIGLLAFGLSACERSLTPSGGATPTTEVTTGEGGAEGTSDVMEQIWLLATQTAQAQQEQGAQETEIVETQPPAETEQVATPTPTTPPQPQQPSATPVTVASPTPGIPQTYVLQKGEFPFCIARRFNVNQYELLNINGLSLNSRPAAGTQLRIPQTGDPFAGNRALRSHPTTYTVRAGESLNEIACLFGDVSPDAIAAANNLSKPYNLQAGQVLQIP